MKKLLSFWTILLLNITILQSQSIVISGRVLDKATNEALPFATVGFPNSALGTITNGDGDFELPIPEAFKNSSIRVSYLGYESTSVDPSKFDSNMLIVLSPSTIQLAELVIRPLEPEDYIKRAVKKFPENYTTEPFNSTAYYREKFTENGNFLGMTEGYFKSYTSNYQDSVSNQYQLLLLRKAKNISELEFMKDKRDKKAEKKAEKAAKKGEVVSDSLENDLDAGMIVANFGGPDQVLEADVLRDLDDFLDSTLFKKYRYKFENDIQYDGRNLMVISFKSKGTYDNLKQEGKIYIDQSSDAIIAIDFDGDIVIPLVLKPILFAFGFSFNDMYLTKKLRYQQINDKWYPNTVQWDFQIGIKKRYLFKSNDKSLFAGEQIYNIDYINDIDPEEIPANLRFDGDEEIETQVHTPEGLKWSSVNALKIEAIKN
ncbi:MAG: carboxypeptidase-like regulatory domain-containing protein [Cyclobacteriaceae bacterium]